MNKKTQINFSFFSVVFLILLLFLFIPSISALDLDFVQNSSNPVLTGNVTSSLYEPYYSGSNGLNIDAGTIKQWFILNGIIQYRYSLDGQSWSAPVRIYNNTNSSFVTARNSFSIAKVLNEYSHTTYYQMYITDTTQNNIYAYNSYDGLNWTKTCLGNPILNSGSPLFHTLDVFYTQFSYNILVHAYSSATIKLYNSTSFCSGWTDTGITITGIDPLILYNSYLGIFSVFYGNSSSNSFSLKQGTALYDLTNSSNYFFNISMEQSYINKADIVDIYDNNANFSHKVYMFFTIDKINSIGVAYDNLNRQLNDVLGQENISYNNGTIENETITGSILGDASDYFSGLFPSSVGKETKTLLSYVFITLLLIDLLLFVIFFFFLKSPKVALWVILIFDTLLFFYFLSIGYIPVGIFIIMVLMLLAILFFKFKGGGG